MFVVHETLQNNTKQKKIEKIMKCPFIKSFHGSGFFFFLSIILHLLFKNEKTLAFFE
jgi:hypothetical protein